MSEHDNNLDAKLRRAWRTAQRYWVLRALAYTVACGVALVFLDLLLDWGLDLAPALRLILLGASAAALIAVPTVLLAGRLRRYHPLRQALREETDNPDLEGLLVAYCQLDETNPEGGVSPDMIRAAKRRAVQQTQDRQFARGFELSNVQKPAALGLIALAILVTGVIVNPGIFSALARRMLTPYAAVAYPTNTDLEAISKDVLVRKFEPVTVVARAAGEVPADGELRIRPTGDDWRTIRIGRSETNEFSHVFPSVSRDFEYQFKVGDAKTNTYRAQVVPPPRIDDATVVLNYPAYTGQPPETVTKLNVEVPEGTVIEWQLELDRPVTAAELATADGKTVGATLQEDGLSVHASLTANASLSYRYRFAWQLGGRQHNDESARHFIQVIPDIVPRVVMDYPLSSGKATLSKQLEIEFSAFDDHSVSEARLVYALNDGKEKTRALALTPGKTVKHRVELDPNELISDLKVGDILSCRIDVADNRDVAGGPQHASSRVVRLQFVSDAEYLADVLERRGRFLGQLRPIYEQEREAYGNLTRLAAAAARDRAGSATAEENEQQ